MKIAIFLSALLVSIYSFADTENINPTSKTFDIAAVETVVTVGKGQFSQNEYLHKLIVVDHGLLSDVSPRYQIF